MDVLFFKRQAARVGLRAFWVCIFLMASRSVAAPALTEVSFASLDLSAGQPVTLKAFWALAPGASDAPQRARAVVLMHGCGGAYNAQGELSARFQKYVLLLHSQGTHALVLDSFTPRGERELCTQKIGTRKVTMQHRRLDALAALQWLAQQPQVDAGKIGLIGWSNGGSAVLAASNERHAEVAKAAVKPHFVVAFYPGCEAELQRGYQPSADLLLLVGEADDWTPAEPCKRLAAQTPSGTTANIDIEVYPGAFHGFDSTAALRVRKDVPSGVNKGQGVTVGGNANALRLSQERLIQFLKLH